MVCFKNEIGKGNDIICDFLFDKRVLILIDHDFQHFTIKQKQLEKAVGSGGKMV